MDDRAEKLQSAAAEHDLFVACLDLDAGQRESLLARADARLAARVRRLLAVHVEADAGERDLPDLGLDATPDLGRYRALQRIGEGGMGEVWLAAQNEPLRRLVAVKLLRPGLVGRDISARFAAERHALTLMNHPGIASIFDGGETTDGRPYIVMEHVDGLPITRYCDAQRLGVDARVRLAAAAAAAVQHAHQRGVIHRDLKPSNILVVEIDGTPAVKVIDFGIAKLLQEPLADPGLRTRVGLVMGTPDYMSPEQASGSPADIDTRTDVWSLGVLLYELLTGVTPYSFAASDASIGTIHERLMREDAPRPSRRVRADASGHAALAAAAGPRALSRKLADDLDWIVLKALSRDRDRRYASAGALAADLERYLAGEAVEAHPPGLGYRLRKSAVRHPAATTAIVAVVFSLAGATALIANHARELAAERDRANREAEIARRVTGFTTEIFSLASPEANSQRLVTARELIDVAARRLAQGGVGESAEVEAALTGAAAEAYRGLGAVTEAEALLERTLALRRSALPAGDPDIARTLDTLAVLARNRGDHGLARRRQVEAEAIFARALGPVHDETVTSGVGIAETDRVRGQTEAARSRLAAIRAHLERAGRADTAGYATALVSSGRMAVEAGDFAAAEADFETALTIRRRLLGEFSSTVMATETDLAGVYIATGQFEAADERLREVLRRSIALYGPRHPEVAATMNNIGMNLQTMGRAAESEGILREAHSQIVEFRGADTPDSATILNNVAMAAQAAGRLKEAETAFRETLAIRRRIFGDQHPEVAVTLVNLGALLKQAGRFGEARSELEHAVELFELALGADHWRTGNAERHLGECLAALGLTAEARATLEQSHAKLRASLGEAHPRTQAAQAALERLEG